MAKKTNGFEADLARLDQIVEALESGDAPLDEALKLYEEGVGLIRACSELLEKAEQSVKKLQITHDAKAQLVAFSSGEDAE